MTHNRDLRSEWRPLERRYSSGKGGLERVMGKTSEDLFIYVFCVFWVLTSMYISMPEECGGISLPTFPLKPFFPKRSPSYRVCVHPTTFVRLFPWAWVIDTTSWNTAGSPGLPHWRLVPSLVTTNLSWCFVHQAFATCLTQLSIEKNSLCFYSRSHIIYVCTCHFW